MKKIILIISAIVLTGLTQAFAGEIKDINKRAVESFSKDFAEAKNVKWEQDKQYAKATFSINDQVLFAYYGNENGELIAVTRNILSDRLPITLMTSFRKNYSDYWISGLFEIASSQGQTNYYLTLENTCETLILESNGSNGWSIYKKEKKQ
ncbi:MAG TPA: hypothetical protein VMI12_10365 [Puia sp.]|nr:hypothetical protein [Puia sp.]